MLEVVKAFILIQSAIKIIQYLSENLQEIYHTLFEDDQIIGCELIKKAFIHLGMYIYCIQLKYQEANNKLKSKLFKLSSLVF